MRLRTALWREQEATWPREGRHILAQFDEESVVVYQAYNPAIGGFAARNGHFGGEFSLSRMSWVKPNFLWMMYRCGRATKPNQEVVLAVTLRREAFDTLLAQAIASSFDPLLHGNREAWQEAVAASEVRLQWDPDHGPTGAPLARRALQLGLRGGVLRAYAGEWLIGIEDVTDFVREQNRHVAAGQLNELVTPTESVYPVAPATAARLGIIQEVLS